MQERADQRQPLVGKTLLLADGLGQTPGQLLGQTTELSSPELEIDAATLVVSQDVDLAIPIAVHEEVKSRLDAILSLLDARPGMPDPRPQRRVVDALSRRLETP